VAFKLRCAGIGWLFASAYAGLMPLLASAGQATPISRPAFFGTQWKLVSLNGRSVSKEESRPHLAFEKNRADGGMATAGALVNAFDGCNRLKGTFERDDSSLRITVGPLTALACATPTRRNTKGSSQLQSEMSFEDALRKTRKFEIHGADLPLEDKDGVVLAEFTSN